MAAGGCIKSLSRSGASGRTGEADGAARVSTRTAAIYPAIAEAIREPVV
jgi:hypothetical protein